MGIRDFYVFEKRLSKSHVSTAKGNISFIHYSEKKTPFFQFLAKGKAFLDEVPWDYKDWLLFFKDSLKRVEKWQKLKEKIVE